MLRPSLLALALLLSPVASSQERAFIPADGQSGDYFGISCDLDSGVLIGGANNAGGGGAAYLFDAASGQQLHKLLPLDMQPHQAFGLDVAISGGLAVVGAYRHDVSFLDEGAAFVFDVATGQQVAELVASDGLNGDFFAYSVAIDGNTVVVGAWRDQFWAQRRGSAYVFDATTGQQLHKLFALDGADNDSFGFDVAVANGLVLVGAYLNDEAGLNAGAAYLFDAATGQQLRKFTASDAAPIDGFGFSVDLGDSHALIGAPRADTPQQDRGAAYLFDLATGAELAKFVGSNLDVFERFGHSVALGDGLAVVSAPRKVAGSDAFVNPGPGTLFAFDLPGGAELLRRPSSQGFEQDWYGEDVAASGRSIVGSSGQMGGAGFTGGAYLTEPLVRLGSLACAALPNSTGAPSTLLAWGSDDPQDGVLALVAEGLPPFQVGYLLNGPTLGSLPVAAGILCLDGQVGRHASQLTAAGPDGRIETPVDLAALPRPIGGTTQVMAGQTWYFQLWHRDNGTANFTPAVAVAFP